MIDAGRRLDNFRRENFDFGSEEEVEDDFIDPTRSRDLIWLMRRSLLKASDAMERRELKRKNTDDEKNPAGDKKGDDGLKPEEK